MSNVSQGSGVEGRGSAQAREITAERKLCPPELSGRAASPLGKAVVRAGRAGPSRTGSPSRTGIVAAGEPLRGSGRLKIAPPSQYPHCTMDFAARGVIAI